VDIVDLDWAAFEQRPGNAITCGLVGDLGLDTLDEHVDQRSCIGFGLSPDLFLGMTVEGQATGKALSFLSAVQNAGDLLQVADLVVLEPGRLHRFEQPTDDDAPQFKVLAVQVDPLTGGHRVHQAVQRAGELMGIELYDHLIVGRDGFTSMRERGLF
jgi:hypothetical protein